MKVFVVTLSLWCSNATSPIDPDHEQKLVKFTGVTEQSCLDQARKAGWTFERKTEWKELRLQITEREICPICQQKLT